jgi:2-hydroxy-6-oxonona-2,4-dienedioate hydrolase
LLDGPPVILVHGLGVSSRHMIPAALHLAPWFRTIAPDLPGYGRSPKPWHVLDVAELADVLESFMARERIDEAILVSLSFGCQIVVELAARRPDLVTAAVLVGPTIDVDARDAPTQVARLLLDATREPLALMPVIVQDYTAFGLRRGFVTLMHALAHPVIEKLPLVTAPTLIVKGENDPIVPDRWAERMVELLPDARIAVIEGAAHAANFSNPAELADLVREFTAPLLSPPDPAGTIIRLLGEHPSVRNVGLAGSRKRGDATELSDLDLEVEAEDFESLKRDLPALMKELHPLGEQWDRFGHHRTYMLMFEGPLKVDLIFDEPQDEAEPWEVSTENLGQIDHHFWDWTLWLGSKQLRGSDDLVADELDKMGIHILAPMGVDDRPTDLGGAIAAYLRGRDAVEQRLRTKVDRRMERDVTRAFRRVGLI